MLDEIKDITELIRKENGNVNFSDNNVYVKNLSADTKKVIERIGIETDERAGQILLKIGKFLGINAILISDIEKYFEPSYLEESFVILSVEGYYFYYPSKNDTLVIFENSTVEFINKCYNVLSYFKLYNRLTNTDFSDHYNDANNEIIFYSSVNGIVKIIYDSEPTINFSQNISGDIQKLLEVCNQIILKSFLIDALFVSSRLSGSIHLVDLISNSDQVITITKRNYELTAKKFDFEKFKDSLYKEKEKYFTNIREIINKISAQIISVPISVSVAVFSTYKVSDDKFMLCMVMLAFIVYSLFYLRLQIFYKGELNELKYDFERDFEVIKSNSGLPDNLIKIEKDKITRRISSASTLVNWLLIIVLSLSALVIIYIIYELLIPTSLFSKYYALFLSFTIKW